MWTELAHVPRLGQVTLGLLSRQWVTFGGGATRLSPTKSGAVPQAGLQGTGLQGTYRWTGVLEMPWSGRCFSGPGVGAVDAVAAEGVGRVPVGRAVRQGLSFRTRFQERAGLGRAGSGNGAVAIKSVGDSVRGSGLGPTYRPSCGGEWRAKGAWMSWMSRTLGRCESLGFFAVAWSLVLRCSRVAVRALRALRAWLVAFRRFRVRVLGVVSRGAGVPRATRRDGAGDVPLAKG